MQNVFNMYSRRVYLYVYLISGACCRWSLDVHPNKGRKRKGNVRIMKKEKRTREALLTAAAGDHARLEASKIHVTLSLSFGMILVTDANLDDFFEISFVGSVGRLCKSTDNRAVLLEWILPLQVG